MEGFREELQRYVDQTTTLQAENGQLNVQLFELKQRLVEKDHAVAENLKTVRQQYVRELELAKESWRKQAVKYGQQQRVLGREEPSRAAYSGCDIGTMQCSMNISASVASNDAIVSNAFIASGHFTVMLVDFDVADHHISIVNTTQMNINLNGCYLLMNKCGDRYDITENIVLEPRTKLSVWWASHSSDNEHTTQPITHNIQQFRQCSSALSLFWNRTGHNAAHPEHNVPALSIYEVAQLFDASHRKIAQVVTNQVMFSVYYDYPLEDVSAIFTSDKAHDHSRADSTGSGIPERGSDLKKGSDISFVSTLDDSFQGQGGRLRRSSRKTTAATPSSVSSAGATHHNEHDHHPHPVPLFPHSHYTRRNTREIIRYVEDSDELLMDYSADVLCKLDRYSKRSLGNVQLCHFHQASSGALSKILDVEAPSTVHYQFSSCHSLPTSINVDTVLKHGCITIENICAEYGIDLHPKCEIQVVFNDGSSTKDLLRFALGQYVMIPPRQRVLLMEPSAGAGRGKDHVIETEGCGGVIARLQELSRSFDNPVGAPSGSGSSSSSSNSSSGRDAPVRTHNLPLCFITLVDQHDSLLFCAVVVKELDMAQTVFAANARSLSNKHPLRRLQNHGPAVTPSSSPLSDASKSSSENRKRKSDDNDDNSSGDIQRKRTTGIGYKVNKFFTSMFDTSEQ